MTSPTPYLANPARCKEVVRRYGFSFRKKYGQNFLIDERVLEDTIAIAGITKDDFVLEIGPGIGTLTQYLASAARSVVAVEIDKMLLPILEDTLSDWDNVRVINADILKTDIRAIADSENEGRPIKIAANLPYYITTPIIMGLLESGAPIESMTVMVQKEVAERMVEGPGSKTYGALSLAVQYFAETDIARIVKPSSFLPQPGVDSAIVHMKRYATPPVAVKDERQMFRLIRAAFNERRKTLANAISNDPNLPLSKEDARALLVRAGFSETVRGEQLSLAAFARLSDLI